MKIIDLRCAVIGRHPIVRILTDEGIVGTGQVESSKPYLKPHVLFYRDLVLGMDPTDVERVMLGIRRLGGFKPWGSAVSAIEMALWDIAGKAAGVPVYKLLGGKIRDRVRVYLTGSPVPVKTSRPEEYAAAVPRRSGAAAGVHHCQDGRLLPQRHARARARLLLRGELGRPLARQPGAADGAGPEARDRLRRGDEGRAGRRGRSRPRLWSGDDGAPTRYGWPGPWSR